MVNVAAQLRPLLSLFHRKWRHFVVKKILRDACIQINSTLYKKGGYTKKYIFFVAYDEELRIMPHPSRGVITQMRHHEFFNTHRTYRERYASPL